MEEAEEALVDAPLRCGNPDCPGPNQYLSPAAPPTGLHGHVRAGSEALSSPERAVRSVVWLQG
eukprot:scaffold63721_cov78-Phaeocystis_antarctica.AAC.1